MFTISVGADCVEIIYVRFLSCFLFSYSIWITLVFPGLSALLVYIMLYVFDMDFVYMHSSPW
jgi:hypothetical protein